MHIDLSERHDALVPFPKTYQNPLEKNHSHPKSSDISTFLMVNSTIPSIESRLEGTGASLIIIENPSVGNKGVTIRFLSMCIVV